MGFGDDIKEFENDATGQGGNDGDNNANGSNGKNDKTEDTMVDSGMLLSSHSAWCGQCILDTYYLTRNKSCANLLPVAVDQFAGKEGLPAGADPEVNNLVNDEVNKL